MLYSGYEITFHTLILITISGIVALNEQKGGGGRSIEAEQWHSYNIHSHRSRKRSAGDIWTGGIIPYIIDEKSFDEVLRTRIMKAIKTLELKVCLKFKRIDDVPKVSEYTKWLFITNRKGKQKCSHESIKTDYGAQQVIIGYQCLDFGNIIHHMLVMAGIPHEHNNPKRDDHIEILWNNVREDGKIYFDIKSSWPFGDFDYDYGSITHFSEMAFTKNGAPTIKVKGSDRDIGQRTRLSEMDIEKINILYKDECQSRDAEMKTKVCNVFYEDDNKRRSFSQNANKVSKNQSKATIRTA